MPTCLRRKQEAYQLVGQAKRRVTKIRPKAVGGDIFGRFFSNFDSCRPEVAGDVVMVVSSMTADQLGTHVHAKFADSTLNSGRRLVRQPDPFYALVCSI